MKKVLIFAGGWDGHQPELTSVRFAGMMEKHGYEATIIHDLAPMAEVDYLMQFELLVACWTMGEIPREVVQSIAKAVGAGVGLAGCHGGMCDAFRQSTEWQFITGGQLNVRRILEKFIETFDYLYGDADETFLEDAGRRYFLLFLKPIINGVGSSYVEPETRNRERMDLVIAYRGQQFIIELKIWRGNTYNERGEQQLSDYLDYFHLKKGYMLSFNFNKKKTVGIKEVILGDKLLIEAVV